MDIGKTGFVILIIIGVLFVAFQTAGARQRAYEEFLTLTPSGTPTVVATLTPDSIALQGEGAPTLEVDPLLVTQVTLAVTRPVETPVPTATSTPTLTPTVTPSLEPTALTPQPQSGRHLCAEPGCIEWTRQFTVSKTMNRWQVWQQEVGPGMMSWRQFMYEVEAVNQVLWHDGHMFKTGKVYLLPACAEMEPH